MHAFVSPTKQLDKQYCPGPQRKFSVQCLSRVHVLAHPAAKCSEMNQPKIHTHIIKRNIKRKGFILLVDNSMEHTLV